MNDIGEDEDANVRLIVQKLKAIIRPSETVELMAIRERYRAALAKAKKGSIKPSVWWDKWYAAYREASAKKLVDMDGVLATKDFLEAV